MTSCERSYEKTKRRKDDIYWQASFLKHEIPALKNRSSWPLPYKTVSQQTPPVGSVIYSFVNSMIIFSHVLLELMLKSTGWPVSDEFGDGSRHFIFASWNAIMKLMEPTVQTAIKGFGCCWPCSAKMHLYGTKTKQQHSALACQQRYKVFAFFSSWTIPWFRYFNTQNYPWNLYLLL